MKHIAQIREIQTKNKKTVTAFMREHGIDKVVFEFDGCGDSGQIENCSVYPEEKESLIKTEIEYLCYTQKFQNGGWEVEEKLETSTVESALEDLAYHALENAHGGWEINEGSYGEITVRHDGTGSIEYNERVVTTEYSETEF